MSADDQPPATGPGGRPIVDPAAWRRWEVYARAHQQDPLRDDPGRGAGAPRAIWAAWSKGLGIQSTGERRALELAAARQVLDDRERAYLMAAPAFRATVAGDQVAREDAARFLRQGARMFRALRQWREHELGGQLAGLYEQAGAQLEQGPTVELDVRELGVDGRRTLAQVLDGTARRASSDLGMEAGALRVLQRLAEQADRFAGPDPVRQARERELWRNEQAWTPYTSELFRGGR
jgi:hypothetical protein